MSVRAPSNQQNSSQTASKQVIQPYTAKNIINNNGEQDRQDDPAYIRLFPKFVASVYSKQPQYVPDNYSPPPASQSFRTVGERGAVNTETGGMTTIPSDFEHIFHFSDAEGLHNVHQGAKK